MKATSPVAGTRPTSEMGFDPDWLALREPADHAARDAGLLAKAAALAGASPTILDLGCGTGSTIRAFGDKPDWHWRLFDGDQTLLDLAARKHTEAETVRGDLKQVTDLPLQDVTLVTASALLDLMPRDWVRALAKHLKSLRIPFYAALTYNGWMSWTPAHAADAEITSAFNAHQQRDKGIGPALGPKAAEETKRQFEDAGFHVSTADSPWVLRTRDAAMQKMLLSGIATAADEAGAVETKDWLSDRQSRLEQLETTIGHTDLLAVPQLGNVAHV